jgi:hypothetical protein
LAEKQLCRVSTQTPRREPGWVCRACGTATGRAKNASPLAEIGASMSNICGSMANAGATACRLRLPGETSSIAADVGDGSAASGKSAF